MASLVESMILSHIYEKFQYFFNHFFSIEIVIEQQVFKQPIIFSLKVALNENIHHIELINRIVQPK